MYGSWHACPKKANTASLCSTMHRCCAIAVVVITCYLSLIPNGHWSSCMLPHAHLLMLNSHLTSHRTCAAVHGWAVKALRSPWCVLLLQTVQFLTVDYGQEFCDYYGARCNRQNIETCRVKAVSEVPPSTKMSWVQHKLPLAPSGEQGSPPPAESPSAV